MNEPGAKQQIVEKVRDTSNILVTVSTNPSVDELSAALGLTLLLNKMNKHATAVFSGNIPPAITFLDPAKTFENTVDSLRDFIIALDKEKADHLRYKLEGDVVKIFITPYRTTITGDDLEYSQGDYNVELVLALGVKDSDNLDKALAAHGRILHDATVATITSGGERSGLGSIDWREDNSSSLSEMLVSLSDALKNGENLLDEQIATAFLTGVVAATDRFSNNKTSSKVMTIAAQLMAAGANQQLIASKLEEADAISNRSENTNDNGENPDGTTDLSEGKPSKVNRNKRGKKNQQSDSQASAQSDSQTESAPKANDGSLTISHEKEGDLDDVAQQTATEKQVEAAKQAEDRLSQQANNVSAQSQETAAASAEQLLAEQLSGVATSAIDNKPSVADLQKDLAAANADVEQAASLPAAAAPTAPAQSASTDAASWQDGSEPSMGGTLNATTEQAADESRKAAEHDRNHTILSHNNGSYVGNGTPTYDSPFNSSFQPSDEPASVDPMTPPAREEPELAAPQSLPPVAPYVPPAPAQYDQSPTQSATLAELDEQNRQAAQSQPQDPRAAVEAALQQGPSPETPPAIPLPPMPDFSTLPPLPPIDPPISAPQNNDLPPDDLGTILPPAPTPVSAPSAPSDPGQFKIPGQQ